MKPTLTLPPQEPKSTPPNEGTSVSEPMALTAFRPPSEFIRVTPIGSKPAIRLNRNHIIDYRPIRGSDRTLIRLRDGLSEEVIDSVEVLDALLIGHDDY